VREFVETWNNGRRRRSGVIYLKSTLTGFIAVLIAIVVSYVVMVPLGSFLYRDRLEGADGIGWDLMSWLRSSAIPWTMMLLAFASGFYWQFRKS
jgi:hypothetical protein